MLACSAATPGQAQIFGHDPNAGLTNSDRNVFFFGGRFQNKTFGDFTDPASLTFEDNFFLGAGTQFFFSDPDYDLRLGTEAGAGIRFGAGEPLSGEAWGGFVLRHDGVVLFDTFRISPSIALGMSVVTAPIGIEADRSISENKGTSVLVYMSPEIAVTPVAMPNTEVFLRLQHRSGGLGFIESFDGSNAATLGFRLKY
jgi:hypothetical protein